MSRLDDLEVEYENLEYSIDERYHELAIGDYDDTFIAWEKDRLSKDEARLEAVSKAIAEEEKRIADENARQAQLDTIPYRGSYDIDFERERRRDEERFLAEKYRQEQTARHHERWHREVSSICEPGYCPYRGPI